MDARERTSLYVTYLTEEGYTPQVDSDGHIVFEFDGGTYYISVYADDPEYFRLIYPNFWPINSPVERARAYIAADRVNRECKLVKVYLESQGKQVSAEIEEFFDHSDRLRLMFRRALQSLRYGVQQFADRMRKS